MQVVRVSSQIAWAIGMLDNSDCQWPMAKERIPTHLELSTKENGALICNTVKELRNGSIQIAFSLDTSLMVFEMDMEFGFTNRNVTKVDGRTI